MTANKKHEAGIVSIMVTMVMLIVISLIVLGLAEISRTEQRNSADDQLSVQAFYGAESGVNDAIAAIDAFAPSGIIPPKPNCLNNSNYNFNGSINSIDNVSYTCLTINPTPTTLSYTVSTSSTVIPLTSSMPFNKLTLDWGVAGSSSSSSTCNNPNGAFPPVSNWNCNFPVLRVDLLNANGTIERIGPNSWATDTATMFFVPTYSGPSPPALLNSRGSVFATHCSLTDCINTIILGAPGKTYYMRVTSLYKSGSTLTVTAALGNGNVQFSGSQVVIDSTGKAQDILRRIQVAVDLTDANSYIVPSSALITEDSVCKEFGTASGYFNNSVPALPSSETNPPTLC